MNAALLKPQLYTDAEVKAYRRHLQALANTLDYLEMNTAQPFEDVNENRGFLLWQLGREEMRARAIEVCRESQADIEADAIKELA